MILRTGFRVLQAALLYSFLHILLSYDAALVIGLAGSAGHHYSWAADALPFVTRSIAAEAVFWTARRIFPDLTFVVSTDRSNASSSVAHRARGTCGFSIRIIRLFTRILYDLRRVFWIALVSDIHCFLARDEMNLPHDRGVKFWIRWSATCCSSGAILRAVLRRLLTIKITSSVAAVTAMPTNSLLAVLCTVCLLIQAARTIAAYRWHALIVFALRRYGSHRTEYRFEFTSVSLIRTFGLYESRHIRLCINVDVDEAVVGFLSLHRQILHGAQEGVGAVGTGLARGIQRGNRLLHSCVQIIA